MFQVRSQKRRLGDTKNISIRLSQYITRFDPSTRRDFLECRESFRFNQDTNRLHISLGRLDSLQR